MFVRWLVVATEGKPQLIRAKSCILTHISRFPLFILPATMVM